MVTAGTYQEGEAAHDKVRGAQERVLAAHRARGGEDDLGEAQGGLGQYIFNTIQTIWGHVSSHGGCWPGKGVRGTGSIYI